MALAYLLDPVFEIQNSAGKPATDGWLEVYVHGSRERYYCASDFDGTLHPFKIPLDSLGSNIVLADDDKSYDVYVYNRYGSLLMSRYAVTTGAGNLVYIVSGDGSIDVTWTDNGHIRTYDIRQAEDGEDLLDWFKSIGSTRIEDTTIYLPGCTSGTMEMGEYGPRAGGSQYYHATAHVQAVKTETEPYYDKVLVRFYARNSEGVLTLLESSSCIVDWSQGLTQEFDVSCDLHIATDCEICVSIEGQDVEAGGFELANLYLHRVYSGTPRIPSGVISRSEMESALEGKQDTLIAGDNITIENNVISATGGGGGGSSYTAGNGIVINNDEISIDTGVVQEKLTTTEMDAVDSGINSTKVGTYDTHVADTTIHVTSTEKTNWNAKEDASNKKQSIDDSSTTDFPSSKAVADFVNSSVATATARFLGSFTLTDLGLTYGATNAQIATALDNHAWPSGTTPTNNDYVYVEIQDPQTTAIDDEVRRFKFNGTVWAYEYTLNNSSFTAAEKAAIDSGITSSLVTTYSGHVADSTIHVTSSDKTAWNAKQDAINDLSDIRSGASAGATAVQPGDLATVATTGSYNDLLNKPTIPAAVTVDQTYNSSSTNAQSGTAVAGALATVNQVPASTSSDEDKVLTVNSSGNPVWAPAQVSTQVQSDWTESDTTDPSYIQHKPVEKSIVAGSGISITEDVSNVTFSATVDQTYNSSSTNAQSGAAVAGALATVNQVPASTASDEDKVLTVNSSGTPVWAASQGGGGTVDQTYNSSSTNAQSGTAVAGALATVNRVPASTASDENKALVVNSSGNPIWSNVVLLSLDVHSIEFVNRLPASPVSGTLYLIPET